MSPLVEARRTDPMLTAKSGTATPLSAWRSTAIICGSVKRLFLIRISSAHGSRKNSTAASPYPWGGSPADPVHRSKHLCKVFVVRDDCGRECEYPIEVHQGQADFSSQTNRQPFYNTDVQTYIFREAIDDAAIKIIRQTDDDRSAEFTFEAIR